MMATAEQQVAGNRRIILKVQREKLNTSVLHMTED